LPGISEESKQRNSIFTSSRKTAQQLFSSSGIMMQQNLFTFRTRWNYRTVTHSQYALASRLGNCIWLHRFVSIFQGYEYQVPAKKKEIPIFLIQSHDATTKNEFHSGYKSFLLP
jgi:hypothetical protein